MSDEIVCFGFIGKRTIDEPERELLHLLGQIVATAGWALYAKPTGAANLAITDGFKSVSTARPITTADPFTADPLVVYSDPELAQALSKRRPGWDNEDGIVKVNTVDNLSKLVSVTQLYATGAVGPRGSSVDGGFGGGAPSTSGAPPPSE